MNQRDLIEAELHQARNYRREARRREAKNPQLAALLEEWGSKSESRAETLRSGPLFRRGE